MMELAVASPRQRNVMSCGVVHGISFEILWIQFFPCRFVGCPQLLPSLFMDKLVGFSQNLLRFSSFRDGNSLEAASIAPTDE
jgi:hypothetical protein